MVNIVQPWTTPESGDSFKPVRKLCRSKYDWDESVKFIGRTKRVVTKSKPEFVPVMPVSWASGSVGLIPMPAEAFLPLKTCKKSEESDESDEESSDATDIDINNLELNKSWNRDLVREEKSLHRVVLTHDYNKKNFLKPRGLFNTRNMCFFNSVLQVLLHCSKFNALLQNIIYSVSLDFRDNESVLSAFSEFIYNYGNSGDIRRAISGEAFYEVICEHPKFHVERNRQEDAQEFLSDLLDVLEMSFREASPSNEDTKDALLAAKREELNQVQYTGKEWTEVGKNNKKIETQHAGRQDLENPIDLLFGGKFRSVFQKKGSKPSITCEPFQQIMLDISEVGVDSTQAAVDKLLQEEHLEIGTTNATKRSEFDHLPSILIVQIKRFSFVMQDGDYELGKITKPVIVDKALVLNSISSGKVKFQPTGIIYHHGLSATRGHYTADVLVDRQWFRIDDEQVVPVDTNDVVGHNSGSGGGSRSAYMIFYEKC